jgi:hypothetical protein
MFHVQESSSIRTLFLKVKYHVISPAITEFLPFYYEFFLLFWLALQLHNFGGTVSCLGPETGNLLSEIYMISTVTVGTLN